MVQTVFPFRFRRHRFRPSLLRILGRGRFSFGENIVFQGNEAARSGKPDGGSAQGSAQSAGHRQASASGLTGGRRCEMAHHQFESSCPRHCQMAVTVGFSLGQFSEIFKIRDADGQPYILIGGQAVNYWAEHYLSTEPQLAKLQPFTSEDIDFKGGHADVQHIARQLELSPHYPPKVAMTALSGIIPFQIGDLKSTIEIVRRIPGLSDSVATPAIQVEWGGRTIRVLDPISLLACKLELVATVSQEKRRDVAHLKILLPCVRAFLGELLRQAELGQLPARDWLKVANQVLKLTTNHRARKIASKHQLNWPDILPLSAIAKSQHEKIRRFQEQQLEQGYKRSKGIPI
ncbi:MAG: hypothetical protein ABSD29_23475 [Verrucomicrobiota bacterium]